MSKPRRVRRPPPVESKWARFVREIPQIDAETADAMEWVLADDKRLRRNDDRRTETPGR